MTAGRVNYNPAISTSFKLEIPGFEDYNYFVTSCPLPGLNMGGVETAYKNNATNVPSNRVEYDPVTMTWIVSEDLSNHTRIRTWMHEFAFGRRPITEVMLDINLIILNSNKVPIRKVTFIEAYPTMMSELQLESGVTDAMPIMCSTTFRYQAYDVTPIV